MVYRHCEIKGCNNLATDKHHLFSQTKHNKKVYRDFIDHRLNIMYLCNGCHTTKSIPKLTEKQFCERMKIEIRSKSGQEIKQL